MITIVVIVNISIALVLLYVALQLWQLRLRLVKITNWLIFVDRQTHALLEQAPEKIHITQENISHLKYRKQVIESKVRYLRQILHLILWGQQLWRRYFWLTQLK